MSGIDDELCFSCSAWDSSNLLESENFGYCRRYDMKTRAYEWCITWDKKKPTRTRTELAPTAYR